MDHVMHQIPVVVLLIMYPRIVLYQYVLERMPLMQRYVQQKDLVLLTTHAHVLLASLETIANTFYVMM
jgi:hypothetical protein